MFLDHDLVEEGLQLVANLDALFAVYEGHALRDGRLRCAKHTHVATVTPVGMGGEDHAHASMGFVVLEHPSDAFLVPAGWILRFAHRLLLRRRRSARNAFGLSWNTRRCYLRPPPEPTGSKLIQLPLYA